MGAIEVDAGPVGDVSIVRYVTLAHFRNEPHAHARVVIGRDHNCRIASVTRKADGRRLELSPRARLQGSRFLFLNVTHRNAPVDATMPTDSSRVLLKETPRFNLMDEGSGP